MHPSKQLARFVQELRTQYRLNNAVAGYFQLDNGDELHLIPEALLVRLRYYETRPEDGMLVKALEVVSFVDHRGVWYPFAFTRTTPPIAMSMDGSTRQTLDSPSRARSISARWLTTATPGRFDCANRDG